MLCFVVKIKLESVGSGGQIILKSYDGSLCLCLDMHGSVVAKVSFVPLFIASRKVELLCRPFVYSMFSHKQEFVHVVLGQGCNDRGCTVLQALLDPLRRRPCLGYAGNLASVYIVVWLSLKKGFVRAIQLETV